MAKQLLHLVLGGRMADVGEMEFENLSNLDIVGVFPDYETAYKAWRGAAQRTVDDAQTRYFIVHIHRLMDPDEADNA